MAYDRVILRDLGSRNGIRVNGRIVDEVRLQPGDEVAIGPVLYRFEGVVVANGGPVAPGAAARPGPSGIGASPPTAASPGAPGSPGWLLDDSDVDLIPLDEL